MVEDNAHGFYGKYREQSLGTFGELAALSFHETKNFTSGEGGALLMNDARFIERAEIIREKGTDRSRFFRGEVDKYNWVDIGSSYLPSDLLAAFLRAQLEHREQIQAARRRIWENYAEGLHDWAAAHERATPDRSAGMRTKLSHVLPHPAFARLPAGAHLALVETRNSRGLSLSPAASFSDGTPFRRTRGRLSGHEKISERLLRLPFYNDMTEAEQRQVIDAVNEFRF